MNGTPQSKVLMVGLPQSGKTTFLAALWHIVQETGIQSSLRLKELRGDRAYLNRIRKAWLSCKPLGRTNLQDQQTVALCLQDAAGTELEVVIPDLSGEAFEQHLRERRWAEAYDGLVRDAKGVLLFVHPDTIRPGHRLDTAARMEGEIRAKPASAAVASPEAIAWSHDLMPTQVQLVEHLQFLLERREHGPSLRVAVVISAWDLVANVVKTPEDVVSKRLPLLWQFLSANSRSITHRVVGISAQGGDLEKDRESLLQRDAPSERIRVVGVGCDSHDLSAPLAWLLG